MASWIPEKLEDFREIGTTNHAIIHKMAMDEKKNLYVLLTEKVIQNGRPRNRIRIQKFTKKGELVYDNTEIGLFDTIGQAIAVDREGCVYITGMTRAKERLLSSKNAALQEKRRGLVDAFVLKLSANGEEISYFTYLGGSKSNTETKSIIVFKKLLLRMENAEERERNEYLEFLADQSEELPLTIGTGVCVDGQGNIMVTGATTTIDFFTRNAFQPQRKREIDAFIIKIDPFKNEIIYASYLGSNNIDLGWQISTDNYENTYLVGVADYYESPFGLSGSLGAFLLTENVCQPYYSGGYGNGFVTKIDSSGNLIYSTYLGGTTGYNQLYYGCPTNQGEIYVTGIAGYQFKISHHAIYPFSTMEEGQGIICRLSRNGKRILQATYLSGSRETRADVLVIDKYDNVYAMGSTLSSDFETTIDGVQPDPFGGARSIILCKFHSTLERILYATYLENNEVHEGDCFIEDDNEVMIAGILKEKKTWEIPGTPLHYYLLQIPEHPKKWYAPIIDPNLRRALNDALKRGVDNEEPLTLEDMCRLPKKLDLTEWNITKIEGLEYARYTFALDLSHNQIKDLTPLGKMEWLQYLDVSYNRVRNLSSLLKLSLKLAYFNYSHNEVCRMERSRRTTRLMITPKSDV
ncbi:cell surface protein [Lachnospiraceae bacterium KM106-2]|nr:cell surface protein [Lachnospiraceae bacterium KM106-2]